MEPLQRVMAMWGAMLMVASLLVGGLAAGAMSGTLTIDGKMLLAAHVTGIIGVFFIFAVAWSLPALRYGETSRRRLAWAVVIANWANLLIGTAKAPLAVHGVGYTDSGANNVVFILLNLFVVVPTFVASVAWAWGLRGPGKTA